MSERRLLLELLKSYEPQNQYLCGVKERFIDFVLSSKDCFLRSNLYGHITASAWLLDPSKTEVLLTHHKKLSQWLQLGGHADGDADILRVALREAEEESGIMGSVQLNGEIFDLDIHQIPRHKDVPEHFHFDVRFVLVAPHKNFSVSSESNDLSWVPISALATDPCTNKSLQRMAQLWLQELR